MSKYSFITLNELNSILYYQGAVDNIELDTSTKRIHDFYKIENAYETLNVLLFPGIENEYARLYVEKRNIDDSIFDCMDELLNVYCRLYSAMCKYTLYTKDGQTFSTYRDDRKQTYTCMQNGTSDSFLSTTLNTDRQNSYFQKKDGLVLMDIVTQDDIEHIDVNDILGSKSIYPSENEILFSPFLCISLNEMELTEDEKKLQDIHKNPPCGKYLVTINGSTINMKKATITDEQWLDEKYSELTDIDQIRNIKIVWNAIKNCTLSSYKDEIEMYIRWKENLRLYLKEKFSIIKYEEYMKSHENRFNMFINDLERRECEANYKREKYEKTLSNYACLEIVIGVLGGVIVTLILMGYDSSNFRVLAVILFAMFAIIKLFCETKALKAKLLQRTTTFLRYSELSNGWKYEKDKNDEVLDLYIKRMRKIEELDNESCIQYTTQMINSISLFEDKTEEMKKKIK